MGNKMGLSNANLFAGFITHQFFSQYYCPEPELHGRYIDDCIGITSSIRKELNQFITAVNSFHPAHKYIYWQISGFSGHQNFKVEGNGLCTSVYYKPTDSPSYLLYSSNHFTCTPANVIYCITCTYCKKFYIGETGRRLGDRIREHLRDVERNDKDTSKPVAKHLNLPNHSKQHMAVCDLSLHLPQNSCTKF